MTLLDRLRGGLIVSVQARAGSALDYPHVLAAMARAAQETAPPPYEFRGCATCRPSAPAPGFRSSASSSASTRAFEPYITPTLREVREVLACGAEIVAFDATGRPRPGGVSLPEIGSGDTRRRRDRDGRLRALRTRVCAQPPGHILATTLCGYTKENARNGAARARTGTLVRELSELQTFVICEGGVHAPPGGAQPRCRRAPTRSWWERRSPIPSGWWAGTRPR